MQFPYNNKENHMRDRDGTKAGTCADTTPPPKSGQTVNTHIGSLLREMFDGVVHEPIPDKIQELIKDLEQRPKR